MKPQTRAMLGLLAGLALGLVAAYSGSAFLGSFIRLIEPVGQLWLNAIRMTVIPLVVSLLVQSIAGRGQSEGVGALGLRAFLLYLVSLSVVAVIITLIAVPIFGNLSLDAQSVATLRETAANSASSTAATVRTLPKFSDWLVSLVPVNPIKAAADGAMLPLVVFSILFGAAIRRIQSRKQRLLSGLFTAVSETMLTLVKGIIVLTPIGVFALVAPVGAKLGVAAAGAIGYYMLALSLVFFAGVLLLYPVCMVAGGMSLRQLLPGLIPTQVVAFTTRSSLATLPAMLEGAERMAMPREVAGFALPLGVSTFKLNTPISYIAGATFISALYGIPLTTAQLATIGLAAIALSFSAPGIPSGGLFMLAPIFESVGLPVAGVGIVIALDLIPDTFKTSFNVTADIMVALALGRHAKAGVTEVPVTREAPAPA